MIIDKLIDEIIKKQNPTALGLDTSFEYLPLERQKKINDIDSLCKEIITYNKELIDALCDIVPAVKVQVAYYEQYGYKGMQIFEETLAYAKKNNLITIADIKRNDIGSTSMAYAKAYLSGIEIGGKKFVGFNSDFITVNPYLGSDGILPFVEECKKEDKGLFVLVKTSNPSSGEIQNKDIKDKTVYEEVADLVEDWGLNLKGKYGYSSIGAVVGATHKEEGDNIRRKHKKLFFLIPGYGAQGGSAKDLKEMFDNNKLGGIVNNSRGLICAFKKEEYMHLNAVDAAREAALAMKDDFKKNI